MSTPVLRATARLRPVLLEGLRQRGDYLGTTVGLILFAVWQRTGPGQVDYMVTFFGFLLAGLLPALPHERPPVWDAAMPVDRAGYALVRLICGVVRAAFMLAVVTGLYVALFADPEHPGWYPLALFAWGLAAHLVISATFLSAIHPAVPLVCLGVLVGVQVQPGSSVDPAELRLMGVWEVLARTALPLGLAGAAAYVATRFPAGSPRPAGPTIRHSRTPRDSAGTIPGGPAPLPSRPARPPVRRSGLARPSAAPTVFGRHLVILRRFTIVLALTLLVFAWLVLMDLLTGPYEAEESQTVRYFAESMGLRYWCGFIVVSWTVLVWLGERGPQRRWNDALPVGTAKRRILHAAAGAAWLLLFLLIVVAVHIGAAAAAGTLPSPAAVPTWLWLGLPVRMLTLYFAATFVLFGIRMAWDVFPLAALFLVSPGFALVANHAAGGGNADPVGWGYGISMLWLGLYAAAAAMLIALNDWFHRLDRLPSVREVRGFLHEWAGTPPRRALRGHARQ
ncbi:MAG TPA: hypothetical protein VFY65_13535 [Longimicrobium sp.]|nr:hypothetical protein [Longimicrobium sp.]